MRMLVVRSITLILPLNFRLSAGFAMFNGYLADAGRIFCIFRRSKGPQAAAEGLLGYYGD